MKRGLNPLYPKSDGKEIMGAYEEAAFMDDTAETFKKTRGKRQSSRIDREADLEAMESFRKAGRELSAEAKQTITEYRQRLKLLRKQKRAGEISRTQFHKLKRQLVKETDSKDWASWKKFWLG